MPINHASLSLILIFALSGCSAIMPGPVTTYVQEPLLVPSDQPKAVLKNGLAFDTSGSTPASITTPLESCDFIKNKANLKHRVGLLFKSDGSTAPELDVPAGKPLYIQYSDNRKNNAYCVVNVVVKLVPGKSYTLIGGQGWKAGPIPLFTGSPGCQLGVLDDETRRLVPTEGKLCPSEGNAQ